jgi:regulatory protein
LLQAGIAKGDKLTEKRIRGIMDLENRKQAESHALSLLAYRARSIKEIKDRLKQRGYSEKTIDGVLQELKRLGLVDDTEFAILFARSRIKNRPMGRFMLEHEMKQKGLSQDDIDKGIEAVYEEADERQLAMELARKKKPQDAVSSKNRVSDLLRRRGFSWEIISDVLENWEQL